MHEEMDLAADIKVEEQKLVVTRTGQNSEGQQVRNPEVAWPYNSIYEDKMHKANLEVQVQWPDKRPG